mgnify:CR=1 FL=1
MKSRAPRKDPIAPWRLQKGQPPALAEAERLFAEVALLKDWRALDDLLAENPDNLLIEDGSRLSGLQCPRDLRSSTPWPRSG